MHNRVYYNINLMKEDDSKRRRLISEQLKDKIKKKPYTQHIDGKQFIYSLLKKKNKSFFLSNERLLILAGNEAIAYARNIPEQTTLPFYDSTAIPSYKQHIELSKIANVTTNGDSLVIEFAQQTSSANWEFVCDSSEVAEEWKQHILSAVRYMQTEQANNAVRVQLPEIKETAINSTPSFNANLLRQPTPAFEHVQIKEDTIMIANNFVTTIPNQQSATQLHSEQFNVPTAQFKQPPIQLSSHQPHNFQAELQNVEKQPKKKNLTFNQTIDLQTEYRLKKKQEEQQKQHLETLQKLASRHPSVRSGIEVISELYWDYEFAKGENEYLVIEQFKKHVETKVTTLIDELALSESQRQIKPIEQGATFQRYQLGDISFLVYSFQLAEVQHFEERVMIVNCEHYKKARQEFKNANYILQNTRNRGRFRVPLTMIVEYKGFAIVAKADVHSTPEYSAIADYLLDDVAEFEAETRIDRSVFEQEVNVKVVAADQEWFQRLNRIENKFKNFDICFLTDICNFLPRDLHTISKDGVTDKCLRAELLENEKYDEFLFAGDDVSRSINKMSVSNEKRNAIALLSEVSQSIPQKFRQLAVKLGNLDEVFANSQELSDIMHLYGLNMRYIGQIINFTNSNSEWLKSMLMAEVVARAAKYFIKYDLQESTMALKSQSVEESYEFQVGQVIGWLNRIFGVGSQSDGLWSQITRQAIVQFRVNIQKQGLNVGYLLQALQHNVGFKLKLDYQPRPYFKTESIFFRSDFQQFLVQSTVYDPSFTDHYNNLQTKLETYSFENYQFVSNLLSIEQKQAIDTHYALNDTHHQLASFLINWLSPHKAPYLYDFDFQQQPSKVFYQRLFTAIKWSLKADEVRTAEQLRDKLIAHINFWLGQFHPCLTTLYDIFSRFYLGSREEKLAISYSRSSLKNQERLLGANHFKLSDAYYSLGDIQFHYHKKKQAFVSYKKALQIIEQNEKTQSEAFVEINNKLAQLYLESGAIEQAALSAKRSVDLCEQISYRQGYLLAAEITARCFELEENWQQYSTFAIHLASLIEFFNQSEGSLQRLLKILLLPALRGLVVRSRETASKLLTILNSFPLRPTDWSNGYDYLKIKIAEKSFPGYFIQCLDSCERVVAELQSSGAAARWRGLQQIAGKLGRQSHLQQFLGELEGVRWLVGGHFLEGVLQSEQ